MRKHGGIAAIVLLGVALLGCPDNDEDPPPLPDGLHVVRAGESIQAAVDAADDYDVIVIEPGVYAEHVVISDKALLLRGTDPTSNDVIDATVIDGGGSGTPLTVLGIEELAFHSIDVTVQGLTLTNGQADFGGGLYVEGIALRTVIQQVRINQSEALQGGGGLYLKDVRGTIVRDTLINENVSHGNGGAVLQVDSTASVFDRVSTENNVAAGYGGGYSFARGAASLQPTIQWAEITIARILDNAAGLGAGGLDALAPTVVQNSAIARNVVDPAAIGGLTLPTPRAELGAFGSVGGAVLVTALDPTVTPATTLHASANIFQFNTTAAGGGAVALVRTSALQSVDVKFIDNTVSSNDAAAGGGVWATDGWLFYDETGGAVVDPTDAATANTFSNNTPDDFHREPGT